MIFLARLQNEKGKIMTLLKFFLENLIIKKHFSNFRLLGLKRIKINKPIQKELINGIRIQRKSKSFKRQAV